MLFLHDKRAIPGIIGLPAEQSILLTVLLIILAIVAAFPAGTVTVTGRSQAATWVLTLAPWPAIQASNSLWLDQGPTNVHLTIVLWH